MHRRNFLTAGASAPAVFASAPAANDRIRLGLIGCGGRMRDHMNELTRSGKAENVTVSAVCDVWRVNREAAVAWTEKTFQAKPFATSRYEELLARQDVDAVILAAPDFTHSEMLQRAVEAGKDAYVEKPFGTNFHDARKAFVAAKASKQVVGVGTQRRSDGGLIACAEAIRGGLIGKITRVDVEYHFQEPRWRRDYHMIKAEDIDWEAFRFGRIQKNFDARLFREWQLFEDTTNGIPGLWMSHFIDLVAWFLDDPYPSGVVAAGGVYLWKDGRETSDVYHALLEYPKDCLVSFAMSLTNGAGARNLWFGTKGTLDADALKATPLGSKEPGRLEKEVTFEKRAVEPHLVNWLRCLRTRQAPRADLQAGFSHAVAVCMAAEALRTERKVRFDAKRLEML
jgi:predicted dehydrogenase